MGSQAAANVRLIHTPIYMHECFQPGDTNTATCMGHNSTAVTIKCKKLNGAYITLGFTRMDMLEAGQSQLNHTYTFSE